jgi:hypothetical protein
LPNEHLFAVSDLFFTANEINWPASDGLRGPYPLRHDGGH